MPGRFAALAMIFASALLHAQAPALPPRAFEVVSIKPTPANPPLTTAGAPLPGGRWSPRNVAVLTLISRAYPDYALPGMIVGGPAWVRERRFDIDAKADDSTTPAQYPQLIRQLLADRFRLKTHIEAKPLDVYALVVARTDGRLGPRLRPASATCTAELETDRERTRAYQSGAVAERQAEPPAPCNRKRGLSNGMMRITGGHSMNELAAELQSWTDLKVVDRTGLRGDYEMEFEFDIRATPSAANADTSRPSVFTAVQEQLGLKLERSRQPVDVLIIDSIELPSEN